jgi:putative membrane protein
MLMKRIFSALANLIPLTFFACGQGSGGSMGNGGNMMGCAYGGGFMWLIVLVLAGIGIYFLIRISKSKGSDGSLIETPLDILNRRYAKGEINKEAFDQMKNDLES